MPIVSESWFSRSQFIAELADLDSSLLPIPLDLYESTDSTNTQLWNGWEEGNSFPRLAVAKVQTAGRGQWNRNWLSLPGGLYLSLGYQLSVPMEQGLLITFACAWGVLAQLEKVLPERSIKLKWPNDLVIKGKKLGGLKVETRSQGLVINQAVIGIGLNWCNPIPEMACSLGNQTINSLEQLTALTTLGIIKGIEFFQQSEPNTFLAAYEEKLDSLGQIVQVEGQKAKVIGIANKGELEVHFLANNASSKTKLPYGSIRLGYKC